MQKAITEIKTELSSQVEENKKLVEKVNKIHTFTKYLVAEWKKVHA